jgi:large subunit ribosomal protein L19
MDAIKAVESAYMKEAIDEYHIGDTVKVHFRIVEGQTERTQIYEGLVIAENNSGIRKTVTVRKMSYGVGVERIFPLHSPRVQRIEIVRRGRVRRAKLYYIRDRVGKAAKIRELVRRKTN